MRIVNPTFGEPPTFEHGTPTDSDAAAGTLCLFSNSKPNANELLAGVGERLETERGFAEVGFASKENAAAAADPAILDALAEQYRMAVVAIGD